MSNSLSFGGYNFATYGGYVLNDFVVPTLPPPDISSAKVVGMHGAYLQTSMYGVRDIPVPIILKDYADTAAFYTAIDNLNQIIDVRLGQRALKFDYNPNRYLLAIATSNFDASKISLTAAQAHINFRAYDPFWYSTTETSSVKTIAGTPQNVTETPGGSADTYPVYTIVATAVIAISTTITLSNQSITGYRTLSWVTPRQIEIGDTITVDTATENVTLNGTSSIASIITNYRFPFLLPTANTIQVTGITGATMTITYRARYL